MNTKDGICPRIYQWFFDEKIRHLPAKERIGQLMCDEMHLKAGVYWNTKSHRIVGFASDSMELNLCEEMKSLEKAIDANGNLCDKNEFEKSDKNAKKVNQWRFRSVKGIVHNGEYFYNSGSLSGDELIWQFIHVVCCYESVGVQIFGFESDAGGQNARLLHYLRCGKALGEESWLTENDVLIANPADPSRQIAIWYCATHQLKNMRNALHNSNVHGARNFTNAGATMTWKVCEETYARDRKRSSPITSLTKAAIMPDSWNKMNVSTAKAPFTRKTITEMMSELACDLGCSDDLILDKTTADF